jgi:hypothetical protein
MLLRAILRNPHSLSEAEKLTDVPDKIAATPCNMPSHKGNFKKTAGRLTC